MKVFEQYEKETGKSWHVLPVCHGERAFASDEYTIWMQDKIESLTAERDKICDILYCNQCTDEEKVSGIKTIIKEADK